MMDISEKDFEKTIECTLLSGGPDDCPDSFWTGREKPRPYSGYAPGGYRRGMPEDYDRAHCLLPGALLDFIYATQPKEWEKLKKQHGGEVEDLEDKIIEEMKKRGHLPNISTFAFTATPKPKTLELFGIKRADGKYEPFSLYTMRQAIEENFILDVLENYTTYKAYWSLLKKIEDDPRYDRKKANYLLRSFVDLHEHTITKKVEIIIDHFAGQVAHRIGGRAKAMIVTRSRLHAARYKQAVDTYLKEKKYRYRALVAFSGAVDDRGIQYTESGLNGFPETQTAEAFKQNEYRFLIVANKFQTGFDQPLLHTMYVDRRLAGVHAVQTLSRLNRVYPPEKKETLVIDFANEAEDIQKAFEPYYERTLLASGTDPNLMYDLQTKLEGFHFYMEEEVKRFSELYFSEKATQDKLYAALSPVVDRYKSANKDEKEDFKGSMTDYIRLYAFLSQVIPFTDPSLEKFYQFSRLLVRYLPISHDKLPIEIQQNIDMDSYRITKTTNGKIKLKQGPELEPIGPKGGYATPPEEFEILSKIIQELNQRFGTEFTDEDRVFIRQLEEKLAGDSAPKASVNVNPPENARLTFDHVVNDRLQEMIDSNFKFYKQITDNQNFSKVFLDWLFERYLKTIKSNKLHDEKSHELVRADNVPHTS